MHLLEVSQGSNGQHVQQCAHLITSRSAVNRMIMKQDMSIILHIDSRSSNHVTALSSAPLWGEEGGGGGGYWTVERAKVNASILKQIMTRGQASGQATTG